MKLAAVFLAFSLVSIASDAAGVKKTFQVDGKTISASVEKLSPPVEITEKAKSGNAAVQTYLEYDQLLAQGKIEEAAKLTLSPTTTTSQQKGYMERLGGFTRYKKKMHEVVTTKSMLTYVLEIGTSKMVIGTHPTYGDFANFFDCSKKKCLLTDDVSQGDMAKLGALFGELRDGKIKL